VTISVPPIIAKDFQQVTLPFFLNIFMSHAAQNLKVRLFRTAKFLRIRKKSADPHSFFADNFADPQKFCGAK